MKALHEQGDYLTFGLIRNIQDKVAVKDTEFTEYEIKKENGNYSWNPEKGKLDKEFDFGEKEFDLIIESVNKLNEQKNINVENVTLYEKIIKTKGD